MCLMLPNIYCTAQMICVSYFEEYVMLYLKCINLQLLFQEYKTRARLINICLIHSQILIPTQRYTNKINITYFASYRVTLSTTYHFEYI